MPQSDWIRGPLWREMEAFLGEETLGNGNAKALALYDRMERLLHDGLQAADFTSSLSTSQYNSMRIIQEWWSYSIEEDDWLSTNTDKAKAIEVLELASVLDHASPIVIQMLLGIGPVIPKISTYRLEILRLFQMEFDPAELTGGSQGEWLGHLQKQRERSAFYASIQRTTFPFRLKHASGKGKMCPVSTREFFAPALQTIAKGTIGACIEACPWLKFKKGRDGYPFYLWDVKGKCTLAVDDIKDVPEYICISHTWGRWHDETKPYVLVPGVPWLVPQNTQFRVEDLPIRLEAIFSGKYLWLDLFCIPQDRSERALQEISRQAEIFGNATFAIAWLNNIYDWEGLQRTVEWLSVYCLQDRVDDHEEVFPDIDATQGTGLVVEDDELDNEYSRTPSGWFTSLWTLQEACLRPDMVLCNKDFDLLTVGNNTTITLDSLAALLNFVIGDYGQSPFETIVNRQRAPERLELGTVVEFESLNIPGSKRRRRVLDRLPSNDNTAGLLELYDTLVMCGMNQLFRISPASVFYLGQHRQCSSNRAEAIMSVIGATNWYRTHIETHKTAPSNSELVLGYYPAAFLNESAHRSGANFYASVASNLANLEGVVDLKNGAWRPLDVSVAIGSLLPFTSSQTTLIPPKHESSFMDTQGHPSVDTWVILPDGKIRIREAGVLASSLSPSPSAAGSGGNTTGDRRLLASVLVPGLFSTTSLGQVDLNEWIRTFLVNGDSEDACDCNYAVGLYQQTRKILWGLILKQVGKENVLVKVGTFFTDAVRIEEVPSERVDWIVL